MSTQPSIEPSFTSPRRRSAGSIRREHRNAGKRINRVFMGWHRPLLQSAIDHMLPRYTQGTTWDMDRAIVVLPSSLAARRLQQLLAVTANERKLLLRPPEVVTFGDLPERLYKAKFPFASDLQQLLAWVASLKSLTSEQLAPLVYQPPSEQQNQPWVELGSMLGSLHRELSSDLTLFSDVVPLLQDDTDAARWNVLATLQNRYLDRLSAQKLWDIQTARRVAIEHNEVSLPPGQELILLGTVDLNRAQRYFLDIVGDAVTVLVGAPESWSEGFDPYGALRGDYWQDVCVDLPEETLAARATADEVADEVARCLAHWSPAYTAQQVTIGLPEIELMPAIVERLSRSDVQTRLAAGVPVPLTPPLRLLRAIAEFIASGSFDSFATLIRLPSVTSVLGCSGELPKNFQAIIDRYFSQTILDSVRLADFPEVEGYDVFRQVLDCVDAWIRPLRVDRIPLRKWSKPMCEVLGGCFGGEEIDLDDATGFKIFDSCVQVSKVLSEFADLPADYVLETTLPETIGWIDRALEKERVAPLPNAEAVEMLGWLELSLDDAPALVLTGVHDGRVPESVNGDAFLPNQVRTKLGLLDNDRRYARDCYAMQVILHSRQQLRIITNHFGVDGTPQTPSRLLLAVQPEELAGRITTILKPPGADSLPRVRRTWRPRPLQSDIPIPQPEPGDGSSIERFTATDLNDYLYCPYRYWLKKVCRLRRTHDTLRELEANTFGDLIHNVIEELVHSPAGKSDNVEFVRRFLFAELNEYVRKHFGRQPSPAVRLQVEQARMRLAAFSRLQADRAAAGWEIFATEQSVTPEDGVSMDVDGRPAFFYGRIDRIDRHRQSGRYAIWDYKTGDNPKKPLTAHVSKAGQWSNLQLPLYLHLVKVLGIQEPPTVGYINLPKAVDATAFELAEFSPEQLAAADKEIARVVRSVRAGVFWPPNYDDVYPNDDFLTITQHNATRRWSPAIEQKIADLGLPTQGDADAPVLVTRPKHAAKSRAKIAVANEPASQGIGDDAGPNRIRPLLDDTKGRIPPSWYSSTLIRASAGSGKTYQLAQRVVQLLFAGEATDSILATTFTRKAAGEILERVLIVIAEAILDDAALERLKQMIEPRQATRNGCRYHLSRLCSDLHRLRISTLDGFYNQLARNFSLELALPPGWQLIDPFQEDSLRNQAIGKMFKAIDATQLHSLISQLCKGEAVRGVWREIAGTVEGGYQIYRGTSAAAWSTKFARQRPSADQINQAIEAIRQTQCGDKRWKTAADKMLNEFLRGDNAGFLQNTLVNKLIEGQSEYYKKPLEPPPGDAVQVLAEAAAAQELEILERQNEAAYQLLANYHYQLEEVKRLNRMVTFDDVSQRLAAWMSRRLKEGDRSDANAAARLPSDPPAEPPEQFEDDMRHIHRRMDSRVRHLLLDEFQDTSPQQWSILQPFARDVYVAENPATERTSIFCVGDQKQAIYGWRGGVAELFNVITRQLRGIGEQTLSKSFRSSPVVIEFVNELFGNLDRHDKFGIGEDAIKFWKTQFSQHATERTALPGYVRIFNGAPSGSSNKGSGDEDADEAADESTFKQCVDDVAALHADAPGLSIGVLVRTNAEVTQVINLLRDKEVEASQEGGNPLTDSAAVDLIVSVIAVADHPGDQVANFRVRHSPLRKCLYESEDRTAPEDLSEDIRNWIDREGYAATVSYLAECLAASCSERDQLRLEQLIQLAYRFERFESTRLRDFVAYVASQRVSLPRPAAVRVMTIHQSKGLEFDAVFLANLSRSFAHGRSRFVVKTADVTAVPDGVTRNIGSYLQAYLSKDWQVAFARDAIGRLQESICNVYVAVTRARQGLYIYTRPLKNSVQAWDSVLHSVFVPEEQRTAESTEIYSLGDSRWYAAAGTARRVKPPVIPPAEIAVDANLLAGGTAWTLRELPRMRPSGQNEPRIVDLKRAFEGTATVGAVVGTVVHRWFEDIEWIEGYKFDRGLARQQALDVLTPEQMPLFDFERWVERFEQYLQNPSVREILSPTRYQLDRVRQVTGRDIRGRIENERRLLEYVDGSLLRGTIDRLVTVLDEGVPIAAEIIDYKTDFLEELREGVSLDAWIAAKVERHGDQLRMYRDAISRQFGIPQGRIAMTLMLLSADAVASVPGE